MTQTRFRYLFKNKGNFVYNFKLKKYEHMSETPMHYEFRGYTVNKKKIYGNMPLNNKYFNHYCPVTVSEGLNTDLSTSELMLGKYNKEGHRKCRYCHCVNEIKKAFKEEEDTCKKCLKLLRNEDRINPQIYILWTENQKYRVFTNFHRLFVDRVFRYENIRDKFGKIAHEVIGSHLNTCDSYI